MKLKLSCAITLLIVLATMPVFAPPRGFAAGSSQPLLVGSWWTLKGSYRMAATGSGSYEGTLTETADYTLKWLVTKMDSDSTTLSKREDGSWSCTSTGNWLCNTKKQKIEDSGTWSDTRDFTISLSTLTTIAVSNDRDKAQIGRPTWLLVNPTQLTEGGTVLRYWWVPDADAKGNTITDVSYGVGAEMANVKGIQLKVWSLKYNGDTLGWWDNADNVWSKGPATETILYDPVYGTQIGYKYSFTADGVEVDGGTWTENYSEDQQLVDSNLSFTAPVTLNVQPGEGVTMSVDGTDYSAGQLPTKFDWGIGTTHTLQVNPTIKGATGIQYVFVQWSDGSKEASRTLAVAQETSLTATFKTQYELTVDSSLGDPQGSGWYDANTKATFAVTTPLAAEGFMGTLGGKDIFDHWSGDSTADTATASMTMDGPKTVKAEWRTDNTMPYTIIGAIIAVIVIAVAALLLMKRRGGGPKKVASVASAPEAVPRISAPQPPPSVPSTKFCINCGAQLPAQATFCGNCGSKQ